MPDVAAKLYEGQPGTTDTLLYTDPGGGGGTVVRGINLSNNTSQAATITLALNAGGALGAGNYFCVALQVNPFSVVAWEGFQMVSAGGTVRGLQSTAGAITATISGVQL